MSAPSNFSVQKAVSLAQMTIAKLRDEDGLVIETDEELSAALADENASLDTILQRLVSAALDAKANKDAADERLGALAARKNRYARHEKAYRDTLLSVMEAVGQRKFSCVEASLSVSDGKPKVQIIDQTLLPASLVREELSYVPDNALIKAALERGEEINGAVLSNGPPVLTLRSK